MSVSCHFRTYAPEQWPISLDHLVSPEEQRRGYIETNCLSGFQVYHEHELRRLLNRNIGRRDTVESLADFIRPDTEIVRIIWRIGQKYPFAFDNVRPPSNGWQAMFHHQFEYQVLGVQSWEEARWP
jgi:hypothetical protein